MSDGAIQSVLFGLEQTAKTSDDYYTPAWVFERMDIDFDLDVCTSVPTRVLMAAFGAEHVEAISRLGRVRR